MAGVATVEDLSLRLPSINIGSKQPFNCEDLYHPRPCLAAADLLKRGLKMNVPKVNVSQQKGFFCHIHAEALVNVPPDVVYDVLTHPDNHIIFQSQKECAYRNVIKEEGHVMHVEVEHTATWNFMFLSGVFHTRTMVQQSKAAGTVQYHLLRPSPVLKRFKGSWTLDPCTPPPDHQGDSAWTLMTLDQDMHPAMAPPPPTDRLLRGMLGKQIRVMFEDMMKEHAAIRAGKPQLTYPPNPYKLINVTPATPPTPPSPRTPPPIERQPSALAPSPLPSAPPRPLHPADLLTTPTHLPAATITAATAAIIPTIPAIATLANISAHSIDINDSDLEDEDSTCCDIAFAASDQISLAASPAPRQVTFAPLPKAPSSGSLRRGHIGALSDSMQSFYSCEDSDWIPDTEVDLDGAESESAGFGDVDYVVDCRAGIEAAGKASSSCGAAGEKAVVASGAVGRYLESSSLGRYVTYVWGLLPEVGVLGLMVRASKMVAAGALARTFGSPAADLFVDWGVAGEGVSGQQEGRIAQE